jgi:uncharacterized protein with PIN domain
MKKLIPFLMIIAFISACSSSKYLKKGNYDKAIDKSVNKLMRKPTKSDEIRVLKKAYKLANDENQGKIDRLKLSGQPDIWDAVLRNLEIMRLRQEKVSRLPEVTLNKINYQYVDYDREIASAKQKAAAFYYANGKALLNKGDKASYRQAFDELTRVKSFYPHYKDVDQLIQKAHFLGTNNVLFKIQNETQQIIPENFERDLKKISLKQINSHWLNFDTYASDDYDYDFVIYLDLKHIKVSPEQVKETNYQDKKTVRDGFKYVYDENGNVKKDSNGNDIKEPKYVDIICNVKEFRLHKRAIVSGNLDIYDNRTKQLVKSDKITAESVFDHVFAEVSGNKEAMSAKTAKLAKNGPAPFPNNLQMIYDTNESIKSSAMSIVRRHRRILEQP